MPKIQSQKPGDFEIMLEHEMFQLPENTTKRENKFYLAGMIEAALQLGAINLETFEELMPLYGP